jgi:hypothetical protein
MGKNRAQGRNGSRIAQGGVSFALHAPARDEAQGPRRGNSARAGARAHDGSRPHLCCGSAGTYSILQPDLSHALRTRKLAALESGQPEVIASANIGCIMHLSDGASVKVRHWIELLDSRMVGGPRSPA